MLPPAAMFGLSASTAILTDIFEVQDEVTHHIVEALKVKLTPSEETLITDTPTRQS